MAGFLRNLINLLISSGTEASGPEQGEDGLLRANDTWKPQPGRKRIEIMVTGDPSRVGAVADAIDQVQEKIFGPDGVKDNLEVRVTAFLDNCIHRTGWTKTLGKAAAAARKWHCEQTHTRLADALADSEGEMVDGIVLIGHRFDERMEDALRHAEELKRQGVTIHCFHTGADEASRAAYEQLAGATGGAFLQLTDQSKIAEVMPILMARLNSEEGLLPIELKGPDAEKLMKLLLEQKKPE